MPVRSSWTSSTGWCCRWPRTTNISPWFRKWRSLNMHSTTQQVGNEKQKNVGVSDGSQRDEREPRRSWFSSFEWWGRERLWYRHHNNCNQWLACLHDFAIVPNHSLKRKKRIRFCTTRNQTTIKPPDSDVCSRPVCARHQSWSVCALWFVTGEPFRACSEWLAEAIQKRFHMLFGSLSPVLHQSTCFSYLLLLLLLSLLSPFPAIPLLLPSLPLSGQDLARVLWLKSQNAELWLDRRTNYTRSLAGMSMVGYILGTLLV